MEKVVLDPSLLWSVERFEGRQAVFFQHAVGQRRYDGLAVTERDTNMVIAGMLGSPWTFERKEIRLYPGNKYQRDRWMEFMPYARLREYLWRFAKNCEWTSLVPEPHIPLPVPANYNDPERIDLVKQAQPVLDFVNGNALPCVRIETLREIVSCDSIALHLDIIGQDPEDLQVLAVFIGKMWGPS